VTKLADTIRYAIAENENPVLHANFMAVCFIEGELLTSEVCRNGDGFWTFCSCELDL